MFGIAADVFFKDQDLYDQLEDIIDTEQGQIISTKEVLTKKFFAIAAQRGFPGEKAKELIKEHFNVKHMEELTAVDLEAGIKGMEQKWQIVQVGEDPLKVGEFRKLPVGS
jgi:hypothetical protein